MSDKPKMPEDTRKDFGHFMRIPSRWMDNDVYGHLNNVVYYSYFDTVINRWLIAEAGLDIKAGAVVGLCVESKCRFLRSVSFPDDIDAGLRIEKLGGSSVRYGVGIFRAGTDELCAVGYFVHVFVDRAMKPVAIPDAMRTAMARLVR
ncbi:MAG: acyl-CoA thioesterase [Deltaproteobacteria bacterium]|nr:acyl-CoA thioesterase [Deltaproteobacteria bacterium]